MDVYASNGTVSMGGEKGRSRAVSVRGARFHSNCVSSTYSRMSVRACAGLRKPKFLAYPPNRIGPALVLGKRKKGAIWGHNEVLMVPRVIFFVSRFQNVHGIVHNKDIYLLLPRLDEQQHSHMLRANLNLDGRSFLGV